MTKAREVISNSLSFGLNRLSPGETLDADLAAMCLVALNEIVDEFNGSKMMLFREILSTGTVTGATGTLGVNWTGLSSGDQILGATVSYQAGLDTPLDPLDMARYQVIAQKATGGLPQWYAHDGAATVYFWPVPAGQSITLRTSQAASDFADLDTDYVLPKGYKAALSALLSEKLADVLVGGVTPKVMRDANKARTALMSQNVDPAIIRTGVRRGNVLTGWN